jgi:hypothetical protein
MQPPESTQFVAEELDACSTVSARALDVAARNSLSGFARHPRKAAAFTPSVSVLMGQRRPQCVDFGAQGSRAFIPSCFS